MKQFIAPRALFALFSVAVTLAFILSTAVATVFAHEGHDANGCHDVNASNFGADTACEDYPKFDPSICNLELAHNPQLDELCGDDDDDESDDNEHHHDTDDEEVINTTLCEIEGHKYAIRDVDNGEGVVSQSISPLADWVIGLMKVRIFGETEVPDDIVEVTTDADGYYCLAWDGTSNLDENPDESHTFMYRVYEVLADGWQFWGIGKGEDEDSTVNVEEDDIYYDENRVGTQVGETNGYLYADAEYHVDFYNKEVLNDDDDDDDDDDELTCSLTIDKNPVAVNEPFTLTWSTTLADGVFLTQKGVTEEEDIVTLVDAQGSTTIESGVATATTFEILAYRGIPDLSEEEWAEAENDPSLLEDFDAVDCTVTVNIGDTYKIFGYVWHDMNENDTWEKEGENMEEDLSGWVVTATNGEDVRSTTTDENGRYEFDVPAGTWTITEVTQSEWNQTLPNEGGYVVTVPPVVEETITGMLWSLLVPTAYAATISEHGPYDFGVVFKGCVDNCTTENATSGGGGGSGSRKKNIASDDDVTPVPQVLGEATSALPYGAPNTGAGGTSPVPLSSGIALIGMLASALAFARMTKHG